MLIKIRIFCLIWRNCVFPGKFIPKAIIKTHSQDLKKKFLISEKYLFHDLWNNLNLNSQNDELPFFFLWQFYVENEILCLILTHEHYLWRKKIYISLILYSLFLFQGWTLTEEKFGKKSLGKLTLFSESWNEIKL